MRQLDRVRALQGILAFLNTYNLTATQANVDDTTNDEDRKETDDDSGDADDSSSGCCG